MAVTTQLLDIEPGVNIPEGDRSGWHHGSPLIVQIQDLLLVAEAVTQSTSVGATKEAHGPQA